MTFHDQLVAATRPQSEELFELPFVRAAVRGALSREEYLGFLGQAYHHVRHTVPLLMRLGAALPERHAWLRDAVAHYIAEELGHEHWILADIEACGGDARAVQAGRPGLPCEILVACAWDRVQRGNPLGFFGMVHVLEGTSVRGASRAADALAASLRLPPSAFTYLASHGALDLEHVDFFKGLMDRIEDPSDQEEILHASQLFFRLYGDVLRALPAAAESSTEVLSCS
jgi:hypothetical protein